MIFRIIITLYFVFLINISLSEEIPIIVIAPSKKPQSISTVGTTVTIFDENFLKNSKEIFLIKIQNIKKSLT